jgi:fatty-acyl-CoA synthase
MRGLMMDRPLLLSSFLERAALLFPQKQVITRTPAGLHRTTYADIDRRTRRLAHALAALGVRGGGSLRNRWCGSVPRPSG